MAAFDASKLSSQATLVTIIYSLLAAFNLVYAFVPPFSWGRIFTFLLWVGFTIVTVYDTNCLAESCPQWCWIRTIIYCTFPVVILLIALAKAFSNNNEDKRGDVCLMSI